MTVARQSSGPWSRSKGPSDLGKPPQSGPGDTRTSLQGSSWASYSRATMSGAASDSFYPNRCILFAAHRVPLLRVLPQLLFAENLSAHRTDSGAFHREARRQRAAVDRGQQGRVSDESLQARGHGVHKCAAQQSITWRPGSHAWPVRAAAQQAAAGFEYLSNESAGLPWLWPAATEQGCCPSV